MNGWQSACNKLMYRLIYEDYIKTKLLYNFSGDNNDVDRNPQCTGLVSFKDFIGSTVCYNNPLKTGRYVGILTTQGRRTLSLCEVEVYSRGK